MEMTIQEIILEADDLRPNAVEEERKWRWVQALEREIAEFMGIAPPAGQWPEDREPLAFHRAWDVYIYYLCAKIDLAEAESELYADDMALYNQAMGEARAAWRRGHRPRARRGFDCWHQGRGRGLW